MQIFNNNLQNLFKPNSSGQCNIKIHRFHLFSSDTVVAPVSPTSHIFKGFQCLGHLEGLEGLEGLEDYDRIENSKGLEGRVD